MATYMSRLTYMAAHYVVIFEAGAQVRHFEHVTDLYMVLFA